MDLAKLDPQLPLVALGRTGDDEAGAFIMEQLKAHANIDMQHVKITGTTSFTLVMADEITKQRTFYHCSGGNAGFCEADIPWDKLDVDMLHAGYILVLDALDEEDSEYGTKMARLLHTAQERGIKTSIDMVSENSDRYALVKPCLAYTDYLIVNEHEAGKLTGIEPTEDNLEKIAYALKDMGVKEKIIIHMPDRAVCLSEEGFTKVGSYILPKDYIKGTTGAGDAFCAGSLIGIHEGWTDTEIMEFGSACAVMALGKADATSGLTNMAEIRRFCKQFDRRK